MLALHHPRRQHPSGMSEGVDSSFQDLLLDGGVPPFLPADAGPTFSAMSFPCYDASFYLPHPPSHSTDFAGLAAESPPSFASHPPCPQLRSEMSTASDSTISSNNSAVIESPHLNHSQPGPFHSAWAVGNHGLGAEPVIINSEHYDPSYGQQDIDSEGIFATSGHGADDFVDPSLLQPAKGIYPDGVLAFPQPGSFSHPPFDASSAMPSPRLSHVEPTPPGHSAHLLPGNSSHVFHNSYQHSPYLHRRASVTSVNSGRSRHSPASGPMDLDSDSHEKGRCPHPDCGRVFKDLKAHMLTHQSERPEKCPIVTCEYNQKGFARKYDKNRHTLTHYKGNMICGFCPGSGSGEEKSFNRADVFKRHLTSVHGVEQSPPNSRKRCHTGSVKKHASYASDATGKCSTCSITFGNAQDFYEHLDDCVLRVVQQEEPSEAIHLLHPSETAADEAVKATMERNPPTNPAEATAGRPPDEAQKNSCIHGVESAAGAAGLPGCPVAKGRRSEAAGGKMEATKRVAPALASSAAVRNAIPCYASSSPNGASRPTGGATPLLGKRRRRRKGYPAAWGADQDKMRLKKQGRSVFSGKQAGGKARMLFNSDFEMRMRGSVGETHVSGLGIDCLNEADTIFSTLMWR